MACSGKSDIEELTQKTEEIAIIGAGIAGLTTAYRFAKMDYKVTLLEKEKVPGGLASSFLFDDHYIERYYHFICKNDYELIELCEELGLTNDLIWKNSNMIFFYEGEHYPFGSPLDLLRFKPVSISGRIRFGLNVIYARNLKYWQKLENISARDWLVKHLGWRTYEVIWYPLLRIKFGDYYDQISAAWIWHRIHRVATSRKKFLQKEMLGYLRGGTKKLIDTLIEKVVFFGGKILYSSPIERLLRKDNRLVLKTPKQEFNFDVVVSTIPLPALTKIMDNAYPYNVI